MAKKQFKAESKRLMELMIHSIYTHREIFLRELISNASDACDKLYYHSLTNDKTGISRDDFKISLTPDMQARTLVLSDNGVGMTKDELENNLGTIAKSGSLDFVNKNETGDEIDIIGQFGVGFYSAFMVAERVEVVSRAAGSAEAWKWCSNGADGYTIDSCEKQDAGTEITLHIKPDTDEEKYGEFLDSNRLRSIIKKYSDYIRYPILLPLEKSRKKEDSPEDKPEWETYTEIETINSMIPLWKKQKKEVTEEEYNQFYKEKFHDYENPLKVAHLSTEGAATYNALLYIPAKTPYDYYTREYEKGLQLYASGVMIMEKCADLLPDHFGFVKGLVDSQDLSLNISREMLQHDRQLKAISAHLEKKIKSELENMLKNEREKYEQFFAQFGRTIKYGLYNGFGMNKALLQDLLVFQYSGEGETTTLAEYAERMKDGQKYIYYACGESAAQIKRLPQTEAVLDEGYEIIFLTDDVDEFVMKIIQSYDEKEIRSVSDADIGLDDEPIGDENKDMLEYIAKALDGKVKSVKVSRRLKTHPVCLASEGGVSIEMEKVLNAIPDANGGVSAEKVLELNAGHAVFARLVSLFETDKERLSEYAGLLYTQALLIEGLSIEDPVEFSNRICGLMAGE